MSTTEKPTRQDDLARMLRILHDAPTGGLSIEEIQVVTATGEKWSFRTINDLLCTLGTQVGHEKVRVRQQKVTKFFIKRKA